MNDNKLVHYNAARKELAESCRVDEVKNIRDKALAMEVYAYQAKDAELVAFSTEIKMRATRRIGQLIQKAREAGKLAKGARGQLAGKKPGTSNGKGGGKGSSGAGFFPVPEEKIPSLADQGVNNDLA
jgi:hypothetical protein